MFKSFLTYLFFLSFFTVAQAQDTAASYTKELMIITENDNYNFTRKDRYYSNGIFIRYQWLAKRQAATNIAVKLHRVEAGQMIYNPYLNRRSLEQVLEKQDRPYAGWLYAGYGQTNVFANERVLQFDAVVGILGPGSKGKEVQTNYHKLISLYKIYGWENQVQNEVGVNLSARYYHPLIKQTTGRKISLHATGKATLGNTFTNASTGLLLKLGNSNKEQYTAFWTGGLGQTQKEQSKKTEAILFLEPMLMAQLYNATVQGPLFRPDKGNYTATLNPILYMIRGGGIVSGRRMSFSVTYTVKQREARSMIDPLEVFGAFAVTYRFR